ncbi:MAG: helix-turn-helix transcriptional regulator [Bacteroidetes bacterium]|nr:helix-turn-helix transcriptional regulator [Bacteroidota bacterium]
MGTQLGNRIKELRSQQKLLQRQVAALLEMDTPLYSKIERGERIPKKETVVKLAKILKSDKEALLTVWLADQVYNVVKNETYAGEALKSVSKKIKERK